MIPLSMDSSALILMVSNGSSSWIDYPLSNVSCLDSKSDIIKYFFLVHWQYFQKALFFLVLRNSFNIKTLWLKFLLNTFLDM